ncbi:dimethyl sulfoxide reductase anchor subunit [Rhodospirillaceae bacterium]|nr:dimethyl sulfoxide reductase anchor subunit [Rhodospirillaceae bacterium]MBT7731556.1 dimethyl sulfoxide reductase anchor subunit [Rhodospirillaceae bacterium]MDC1441664.1 dimethyl sulfoxide reductase anchor subunit [Rhodospirillaceae bacterium]
MHPAFSVIFFTSASGAGYGILALLGLFAAFGWIPLKASFNLTIITLALILITAGLLSSTAHLGHPERAWRALSQWRSSWLSREGVFAIITFIPASIFWLAGGFPDLILGPWEFWGLTAGVFSLLTIFCTAQIYASLKTIPQWNSLFVPFIYLLIGLLDGALIISFLTSIFDSFVINLSWIILSLGILGGIVKLRYWKVIDKPSRSTSATATGLGNGSESVTLLDSPTTSENFVMREMGFSVARKHTQKLRKLTFISLFLIPTVAAAITLFEQDISIILISSLVALVSAALGTITERWLFFAEAKHVVTLFYGAKSL